MTGEIPFGATAGQIRDFAESLLASGYPSGTLVVPSGWQQPSAALRPVGTSTAISRRSLASFTSGDSACC